MKLLRLILPFLLSLLCLTWLSCSDSDDVSSLPPGTPHLQLCCTTGSMAQTRAVVPEPGVEAYNENVIHSLDVFLFPLAATEAEQAALPLVYHHHFDGINAQGTHEITDYILSKGTINALTDGATKTQCYAYVVANSTADVAQLPAEATLADVKALNLAVAASFVEVDWAKRKQQAFVMTGGAAIDFEASSVKLSGTVELKRVAAKLEFEVTNVTSEVYDEGNNLWIPKTESMNIKLIHGVKHTRVGGVMDKADDDYFELNGFLQLTKSGSTWPQNYPFYSYPADWTDGNDQVAYVMLTVPWGRVENDENGQPKKDGEGNYVIAGNKYITTYYQIPIGENAKAMLSNAYYRMKIDVGIIGSFDPTLPVTLTDNSYIIVDWSAGTILPIAMKKVNYLAIDQEEVEVYNASEGKVHYVTSNREETSVEIQNIQFWDYNTDASGSSNRKKLITVDADNSSYTLYGSTTDPISVTLNGTFTIDVGPSDQYITVRMNGIDITKLYQPITVNMVVKKTDLPDTPLSFTFYPPIYIVGETSNGYVYVNEYTYKNNANGTYGTTAYDDGNSSLGSAGTSSGNNTNFNNYAIHVSSLYDDSYMIADTRGSENNLAKLSKLVHYLPTREDIDISTYVIPPAYIFASSYGATTSLSYVQARKRCAAYQENGYPAGRWRLPTLGEIQFAMMLSQKGVFPRLFGSSTTTNTYYWYANSNGTYAYASADQKSTTPGNNSVYVRCVYDLWYWGDDRQSSWMTSPVWSDNL